MIVVFVAAIFVVFHVVENIVYNVEKNIVYNVVKSVVYLSKTAAARCGKIGKKSFVLRSSSRKSRQRVPRSLHEKLKIIAAREGVSLNAYVANVLAEQAGRAA